MDFVEICNVYIGKMIIKAAKKIFNSDKICRSYSDLNFGVTFLEHSVFGHFSQGLYCILVLKTCRARGYVAVAA